MPAFVLRFQKFSDVNVDIEDDLQPDNDAYFVGVGFGTNTPFSDGTVTYLAFGDCMSLDGDPEVSLAALPAGFKLRGTPNTFRSFDGGVFGTILGRLTQNVGVAAPSDFARVITQWGNFGPTTQTKVGSGSSGSNSISSITNDPDTIIELGVFLSFNLIVTDPTQFTSWVFDHLELTGDYDITNFSWEIANGIALPNDVKGFDAGAAIEIEADDIFDTVTNPDGTGPCLLVLDAVVFVWEDEDGVLQDLTVLPADFDGDWTCLHLSFVLPPGLPTGTPIDVYPRSPVFPPILVPEGTGTQFDGTIKLGTIKILVAASSGLYTIVADKTSDTVYVDSPDSNTTTEMAIPDPFAKTGFIGG